jgi:hypothetical protein
MKSFAERTGFTYPASGTLERILPASATQVSL